MLQFNFSKSSAFWKTTGLKLPKSGNSGLKNGQSDQKRNYDGFH
jgi:hypothetical protein